MKNLFLFILVLLLQLSVQSQITKQKSPAVITKPQVIKPKPNLINKLKLMVPASRIETYSGTFNNPTITRSVNGVKITSTATTNLTENDNVTTTQNKNSIPPSSEGGFDCTTTLETVTATSSSFTSVSADGAGLYPGALYTFNDFMLGNFLKEVGVGKRNPIQVSTDNYTNSSGDIFVTVNNPTNVSIKSAVASLVRNATVKKDISASQIGQYTYQQNQAAFLLGISGGGAYSGFAASGSFSYNKQSNHIFLTCDFKIPLYTLTTNYPENGFLNDQILEKTPNLIVVSSVTYGTRVLVNIDIDENSLSTEAKAKFKYGDPKSAGFNIDLNFLMQNKDIKSTVNTYVVGANPQNLGNPTTVQDIYKFVDGCIKNTNYQTAKPLSYTLSSMAGDLIGIRSATDEYRVVNCTPKSSIAYLKNFSIRLYTKGNYKEQGSNAAVYLTSSNGNKMLATSPMNNSQFGPNKFDDIGFAIPAKKILKSEFDQGQKYIDLVLDKPNCVITCDDWEIDFMSITCEFEDQNGVPLPGGVSQKELFRSKPFVISKGRRLRVSFDNNFNVISANIL